MTARYRAPACPICGAQGHARLSPESAQRDAEQHLRLAHPHIPTPGAAAASEGPAAPVSNKETR